MMERHRRFEFKYRYHSDIAIGGYPLNGGPERFNDSRKFAFANRFSINADALCNSVYRWRTEQASLVPAGGKWPGDQCRCAAFALTSRDVDVFLSNVGVSDIPEQAFDPFEVKIGWITGARFPLEIGERK